MRTATLVLVAYLVSVIVTAVWRSLPIDLLHDAVPDIGATTAAYLGLTIRRDLAPAVAGSVVLGYLIDVISGTPAGLFALTLGVTCLIARTAQQRILVRGAAMTMGFTAFVAIVAAVISLVVRMLYGVPLAGFSVELRQIALIAPASGLGGVVMWRLFRRIDAAFARTHRERDAALEGLNP